MVAVSMVAVRAEAMVLVAMAAVSKGGRERPGGGEGGVEAAPSPIGIVFVGVR